VFQFKPKRKSILFANGGKKTKPPQKPIFCWNAKSKQFHDFRIEKEREMKMGK
jgi:hypothetical protein